MATAIARPTTAPMSVLVASVPAAVAWPMRNSAVSMPSRITAVKARTERPRMPPCMSARSTPAWSSPLMFAAVRRIQKSIHVTTPAATSIAMPSKICSAGSSSPPIVLKSTSPMTTLSDDRNARPEPDRPEVALVPGLGEVRQDDADDEGRLDALAQAGQQAGEEESEVQRRLPWCRAPMDAGGLFGG